MKTPRIIANFVFFWFVVLLFSQVSFALQDFDAGSDFSGELFQCGSQRSSFVLTNTGDEELELSISVSGKIADFVSLTSELVNLPVNAQKEVFFDVNVPCDARQGSKNLKILVSSSTVQKLLDFQITVEKPLNVDIIANVFSQVVQPCSPVVYNVTVVNTGTFTDFFSFNFAPISGALLSPADAVLSAGEKKDVIVSFTPDDCSLFGEFPQVFSVVAENTGVKASLDLGLIIESTDILAVANGVDRISTNHSVSSARLFVKNEGEKNSSYNLSVEGPDWVRIDSAVIDVPAKSDASFVLFLSPDESVKNGEYSVVVSAASRISERVYSKSITVKVFDNGLFERSLQKLSFSSLSSFKSYYVYGAVALAFFIAVISLIFYFVRKKSACGDFDADEDFYADTKKAEPSKPQVDVVDAKTRMIVEKELRSEFKFIPKSAVVSLGLWSSWIVRIIVFAVLAGLVISVYLFQNFFAIYFDYAVLGVIILLCFFIAKIIFGRFVVSKTFRFLLAGDSAEFSTNWKKGLLSIAFKVVDNVENLRITVKNGLRGCAIPPVDFVCGSCRISANCDESLLGDVSLIFKVKSSLISRLNACEKDLRVVFFSNNRWKQLDFTVKSFDEKFVYVEAFAEQNGVFAVVCKNRVPVVQKSEIVVEQKVEAPVEKVVEKSEVQKSAKKSRKSVEGAKSKVLAYVVLFVLLSLVIGAFVYISGIQPPSSPLPLNGIHPQVWSQDTTHTLNVSKFFHDPDGDSLSFSARPVDNIKIEFADGVVTFIPDAGWSGSRSTVFAATDPEGAVASSNDVSLVVRTQFVPSLLRPYLTQIIGGVSFVVVVILLLVFRDQIIKFLDDEDD